MCEIQTTILQSMYSFTTYRYISIIFPPFIGNIIFEYFIKR